ncbi:beta-1,4-N-acetylgalactosaminyltransferase 3-like [Gastrophryne carolinensis]
MRAPGEPESQGNGGSGEKDDTRRQRTDVTGLTKERGTPGAGSTLHRHRTRRKRAASMWGRPLSVKMLQKHFWLLLLFSILLFGVWTVYLQLANFPDNPVNRRYSSWSELGKALVHNNIPAVDPNLKFYRPERPSVKAEASWNLSVPWNPKFAGRVNLHVFEDWCGSSIRQLRRNLHFPLYPHIRTTVNKLSVTPQWTNYGLRMFGYLHPAADGDFQFAVSSDDNSEFWLSEDHSVDKLQLLCKVGPTGKEWAAPGEYGKFHDQVSRPIRLSSSNRYYFELLHKQDDSGTDHVELAWRPAVAGSTFTLIDSKFLSLFSNDSNLPLGDTSQIPLSKGSHHNPGSEQHPADMLRSDPRDTFYKVPILPLSRLQGVLPSCPYKPSYLVEGYPLQRYQGLQFVRLTYVYPNDYTRLSHMEKDNECMYQEDNRYAKRLKYNKYMKIEHPNVGYPDHYNPSDFQYENSDYVDREEQINEEEPSDYDIVKQRKLFLVVDNGNNEQPGPTIPEKSQDRAPSAASPDHLSDQNYIGFGQLPETERQSQKSPNKSDQEHSLGAKDIRNGYNQSVIEVEERISNVQINWKKRNRNRKRRRGKTLDNDAKRREPSAGDQVLPTFSDRASSQKRVQDHTNAKYEQDKSQGDLDKTQHLIQGQRHPTLGGMSKETTNQTDKARRRFETSNRLKNQVQEEQSNGNQVSQRNHRETDYRISETSVNRRKQRRQRNQNQHPYRNSTQEVKQPLDDKNRRHVSTTLESYIKGKEEADGRELGLEPRNRTIQSSKVKEGKHVANELDHERRKGLDQEEEKKQVKYKWAGDHDGKDLDGGKFPKPEQNEKKHQEPFWGQQNKQQLHEREEETENNQDDNKQNPQEAEYQENDVVVEDEDEEIEYPIVFEQPVFWNRTFHVNQTDFQVIRSDYIDLQCNTSGNLQLKEGEALSVVGSFMRRLSQWHRGMYKLQRIINVEKSLDYSRGSRYFLELELSDRSNHVLRFAQYVFAPSWTGLTREDRELERDMKSMMWGPQRRLLTKVKQPQLCWPSGLVWNPQAMVYVIVPVRNQARWVQKFIEDMEAIHRTTQDSHFSVIIVDFSSTDLDIEAALKRSHLPSKQYVRLDGNFERSLGLQAGANLVKNPHSILFLCDLHMDLPPSIIDSIRTHTIEGKMVYAPMIMRLNCGATPTWPEGFWEVNGFGLLGIYKSDLDRIGGMNTLEFRERWGGEDWELLDRILHAGLEVTRLAVRNFYHHFHSKRGMWNRRPYTGGQRY